MGSWATGDDSASASRWPRRLLLAALAVVVLLACAGAWLVMHTGGGFDRQLAAIRARGEPVTVEELHAYPAPYRRNSTRRICGCARGGRGRGAGAPVAGGCLSWVMGRARRR